jgi:hypothetical protein
VRARVSFLSKQNKAIVFFSPVFLEKTGWFIEWLLGISDVSQNIQTIFRYDHSKFCKVLLVFEAFEAFFFNLILSETKNVNTTNSSKIFSFVKNTEFPRVFTSLVFSSVLSLALYGLAFKALSVARKKQEWKGS